MLPSGAGPAISCVAVTDAIRSPLDAAHRALGAHMGVFAGWEMPISYEGTLAEHAAVRTGVGVFDVSHLGKIEVSGDAAAALLDRALTNRMLDLAPGRARYTLMLDDEGGIVDDMIVYARDESLLVVPNASNVDEVERRLRATPAEGDATIVRRDDAIVAVQGPRSSEIVGEIAGALGLGYMRCSSAGRLFVARSGYTGEHGYEIFALPGEAAGLWDAAVAAGATPCGLAARDTLRLEMGYPLHGNDIGRDTAPAEAGLSWAVGKDKAEFAGKAAIEGRAPRKTLVGIRMSDRVIPRRDAAVLREGERIGSCTSGTFSPTLKTGIALAFVRPGSAEPGDKVEVEVRGKTGAGAIVTPPFVDRSPK